MIRIETDGARTTVTLDRPDKANALTAEMLENLCIAVEEARDQKLIVLTGTGKVFCAGADLAAAKAGLATSPLWERLSGALVRFRGLSICALNGTCAGGAMGMALACDLRFGVPGVKFFYPVMKLGFLPQPSDPQRLADLVGPSRAKLVLMGGAKVTIEDALTWGLLDRVDADLDALIVEVSADVLGADPAHIRGIKSLF